MSAWRLVIDRGDNGYALYVIDPGRGMELQTVVEDGSELDVLDRERGVSITSTRHLLWEVMEFFGLSGSKHDKRRVRVVVEDENGEIEED